MQKENSIILQNKTKTSKIIQTSATAQEIMSCAS